MDNNTKKLNQIRTSKEMYKFLTNIMYRNILSIKNNIFELIVNDENVFFHLKNIKGTKTYEEIKEIVNKNLENFKSNDETIQKILDINEKKEGDWRLNSLPHIKHYLHEKISNFYNIWSNEIEKSYNIKKDNLNFTYILYYSNDVIKKRYEINNSNNNNIGIFSLLPPILYPQKTLPIKKKNKKRYSLFKRYYKR